MPNRREPERLDSELMRTRLLMTLVALLMAAAGVSLTFLPEELLAASGHSAGGGARLGMQILGALYLGFAILNWSARGNLLGGIYGRPIVLGNFMYFFVGAASIAKAAGPSAPAHMAALAIHLVFAIWFGTLLWSGTPVPQQPAGPRTTGYGPRTTDHDRRPDGM